MFSNIETTTSMDFNNFDLSYTNFQDDFDFPCLQEFTQKFIESEISESIERQTECERMPEPLEGIDFDFDRRSIYESASKLLKPSKKISKPRRSAITRQNGEKLAPFFQKWKDMRKYDRIVKNEVKLWFFKFQPEVE